MGGHFGCIRVVVLHLELEGTALLKLTAPKSSEHACNSECTSKRMKQDELKHEPRGARDAGRAVRLSDKQ